MKLLSVDFQNVMSHRDTHLRFPDKGLIVVTGPNGGGKSAIIEAVSLGLFGKTLRGSSAWQTGATAAVVSVGVAPDLYATRTRALDRTLLSWSRLDEEAGCYETTTKAQEALESIIGPHDVWKYGHVFTSLDATLWTASTDADKKRLLEAILGISRFDPALEACRVDARALVRAALDWQGQIGRIESALEVQRKRLHDAEQVLAGIVIPPARPVERVDTKDEDQAIAGCEGDIRGLRMRLRKLDTAGGEHAAEFRQASDMLKRLEAATCPTCAQSIPEEVRGRIRAKAQAARKRVEESTTEVQAARKSLDTELSDLEAELGELRSARETKAGLYVRAKAAADERVKLVQRHADAHRVLFSVREDIDAQESSLTAALEKHRVCTSEILVLSAVEEVLGLRGVRANVLATALAGIEIVANAGLAKLGLDGLQLEIRPYAEKKTGGVKDSIAINVTGAGGGHGYKACSMGERRRIDLALLFGIAGMAAGAKGETGGTIFIDEALDGLDATGRAAVLRFVEELAEDRCVVLVSHDAEIVADANAVARLRVEDGNVSAL